MSNDLVPSLSRILKMRCNKRAVDWSRPDAPAVEEVVGPDGVDFVAGDDALAFGSGVTDLNMVGPLELVVSNGAGEGLAELELLSVSVVWLLALLLLQIFASGCLLAM